MHAYQAMSDIQSMFMYLRKGWPTLELCPLPVAAVLSPDSTPATSCWMMPLNAEATASAVKPRRGGVGAAAPVGAGGTTNDKEEDVLLLCRVPR